MTFSVPSHASIPNVYLGSPGSAYEGPESRPCPLLGLVREGWGSRESSRGSQEALMTPATPCRRVCCSMAPRLPTACTTQSCRALNMNSRPSLLSGLSPTCSTGRPILPRSSPDSVLAEELAPHHSSTPGSFVSLSFDSHPSLCLKHHSYSMPNSSLP